MTRLRTLLLARTLPLSALTLGTVGPHAGLLLVLLASALVRPHKATGALVVVMLLFSLAYPLVQWLV